MRSNRNRPPLSSIVREQSQVDMTTIIPSNDMLYLSEAQPSVRETTINSPATANSSPVTAMPEESVLSKELSNLNQSVVFHTDATLPANWNWTSLNGKPYCVAMVEKNGKILVNKSFLVSGDTIQYHIRGKLIAPGELACYFSTLQELNDIISNFDSVQLCPGCTDHDLLLLNHHTSNGGTRKTNCWRSNDCLYIKLNDEVRCKKCTNLKKQLCQVQVRSDRSKNIKRKELISKKRKVSKQKIHRLNQQNLVRFHIYFL